MRAKATKWISAALASALLLLSACGGGGGEKEEDYVKGHIDGQDLATGYAADDVFSLNSRAEDGFNPYVTTNTDNRLADQLVYENIFEVSDNYELSSRIVSGWQTEDGTYWYFKINPGIKMHDGSTLTAADVSYSIQRAMISSRYAGRFLYVWGVSASEDTVSVSLSVPNMQFPYLLTIPIIKSGSIGEDTPPGTGPYRFSEDKSCLEAFDGYPDWENLPVDKVGLVEYASVEEILTAYEDSYIDLVLNDPSSGANLGYGGTSEIRYIATNNMHYIGFNMDSTKASAFVLNSGNRYAMMFAVDRDYAAKTLMKGAATASVLPINPKSPLYNKDLAAGYGYDLDRCLLVLNNSGVKDYESEPDGKLEYMVTGIPLEIDLDMIVCSEAGGKADVAKKFAQDLASIGVTVNVRELSWNEYRSELAAGNFDLYYGEVKLTADFNLSRLLTEDGGLNYCGVDDPTYGELINAYLAATDADRQANCDAMLQYIIDTAPIIPVCFERQEVVSHRNVASGLNPSQYNIFYNIQNWTINIGETKEENEG